MPCVMIVENSEKPCLSAKKLLLSINYEIVFQTNDGYEAIEKYSSVKPDLLLLDITLLKKDGLIVLNEIKKNHPESKIIVMTLLPDKKLLDACVKSGANSCITIPFKLKDFVTLVTDTCNLPKTKTTIPPIIVGQPI